MRRACVVCALGLALAVGCGSKTDRPAPPAAAAASPGVDLDGMDRSVKPGDNFYAYANGTWLAHTEIPADRATWGTGAMVAERTNKRVADLVQDAAVHAPSGSDARKVG